MENRPVRGTGEFRHVTFAYPGADEPILKDISFESRSGEVTAIIGGTGRGKSSILKLIPRLYDPMFGEVLIDGVNAKEYRTEDLRSLIGYVPQKNVLFSGTIEENLRWGNEDAPMEDVIRFQPNDRTHPAFGQALRAAAAAGVEVLALDCRVAPDRLELNRPVLVEL